MSGKRSKHLRRLATKIASDDPDPTTRAVKTAKLYQCLKYYWTRHGCNLLWALEL